MVDKNTVKKSKKKSNGRTNSKVNDTAVFEDVRVNTKTKLALIWVALMFLYVYNDILSFFQPGTVNQLSTGTIEGMEMTQAFLFGGAVLMSIPSFMIILSVFLPAKTNRSVNIVVGVFHAFVLVSTTFVGGETWAFYAYNMILEGVFIGLIVWTAWSWPVLEQPRGDEQ
ncbi:MAG: hypothetical protein JSV49_00290 [Thermoplasmata archaeon]|nr:MAG: hypothetical protein JSV49_00290 [Thermoplasmata archaeon]